MSVISLEGMKFYAYHGVYKEEKIIGGEYLVDLFIETDISKAASGDDIFQTINYETLYTICEIEMGKSVDLIETLVSNIISKIKKQFKTIQFIRVKIKKLSPPLGGKIEFAAIEEEEAFTTKCGKCGKGMICYSDENCWCNDFKKIHPRTQMMLQEEFGSCLCAKCLDFYVG